MGFQDRIQRERATQTAALRESKLAAEAAAAGLQARMRAEGEKARALLNDVEEAVAALREHRRASTRKLKSESLIGGIGLWTGGRFGPKGWVVPPVLVPFRGSPGVHQPDGSGIVSLQEFAEIGYWEWTVRDSSDSTTRRHESCAEETFLQCLDRVARHIASLD